MQQLPATVHSISGNVYESASFNRLFNRPLIIRPMPKQTGEYRFLGTVQGLCFYNDNGKFLVRTSNPTAREEFLTDKRFERSRWQNAEFAGANVACKAMRAGLAEIEKDFADQYFHSRLRGALRKLMVAEGPTDMGMRPLLASKHGQLLQGLEMNAANPFARMLDAFYTTGTATETASAWLKIDPFIPKKALLNKPKRATHFELVACAVMLSDHLYDPEKKGYTPALPGISGLKAMERTGIMRMDEKMIGPLEMVCGFDMGGVPEQAGVVLFAGVKFYREDAGVVRVMRKGGNCMGVVG